MTRWHPQMRGPPLQPACWPSPNESIYQSPRYPQIRNQPPHPQAQHNVQARRYNYPRPPAIDDAAEVPTLGDYRPQNNFVPVGMVASAASTFPYAAPPIHPQYINYDHTQHPHDRLNIHLSAPPPHREPVSVQDPSAQHFSPGSTLKPDQDTQRLPDNENNLEKMRRERELVFQKAAAELDQARRDTGASFPTNKAWEDAWEVLRDTLTKM